MEVCPNKACLHAELSIEPRMAVFWNLTLQAALGASCFPWMLLEP